MGYLGTNLVSSQSGNKNAGNTFVIQYYKEWGLLDNTIQTLQQDINVKLQNATKDMIYLLTQPASQASEKLAAIQATAGIMDCSGGCP